MDLSAILSFFDHSVPVGIVILIFYVFKLDQNMKNIQSDLKAEIAPIKAALDNHITDTNKKIDELKGSFKAQSERFDRLYEILLKDKNQK